MTEEVLFLPLILAFRVHEAGIQYASCILKVIISCGFMLLFLTVGVCDRI